MEHPPSHEVVAPDPWRKAILVERQQGVHPRLINLVSSLVGTRDAALLLGDASLVQARYLLDDARFAKVVDVDASPSLLDDEVPNESNQRLERILTSFEQYAPPAGTFNLVYGKSIAFTLKESAPNLLEKISASLKDENSLFGATWALEGDTARREFYTEDEIKSMYADAGLEVLRTRTNGPIEAQGLLRPVICHEIIVLAKKSRIEGAG